MKICTKCKTEKPDSEFNTTKKYGRTYLKAMCKPCEHQYYNQYYHDRYYGDVDRFRTAGREYAVSENGRNGNKLRSRKYRSTKDGKHKDAVRGKVASEIKAGRLVPPACCSICGCIEKLEAHHDDYLKPLSVRWMCKLCHESFHHLNEGSKSVQETME